MYKLVVVAGKIRGKEFILEDGENTAGRDSENTIHLQVSGVSKRHLSITVTNDVAYVQDLGSSNGTFVNGKMIKRATVKNGDKIALPDIIMQVVYVKEKKIIIKKKSISNSDVDDDDESYLTGGAPPASIPGKIVHRFKYGIMKHLYGLNEEYQWKSMFAIILAIFVVSLISLTIFPVLEQSKQILESETAKRGAHYADEIARLNNRALEQKNIDRVDTGFLEKESGVASYELFDLEGRIVRPIAKLNTYVSDSFSVRSREWAVKRKNRGSNVYIKRLGDGEIGIAQRIMAYNPKIGALEAVGIIAIRFAPKSLAIEATKNTAVYLEALSISAFVALLFYGIIYFLTVRPLEEIRFQIEEALRGKRKGVDLKYLMGELSPLKSSINSMVQRIRELQNEGDDSDFAEAEDDSSYVDTLVEFMQGSQGPVIVLDSEKNIRKMNIEAEDLTGIRESAAEGMGLLDVAREQGFAATVIELCDNSANNNGTNQNGEYELTGHSYKINVAALVGKDSFAKAYYITFVKED